MRLIPQGTAGRAWLALGASLACHALLVITACQLFERFRQPSPPDGAVDRRIATPDGYAPISLSFDDAPAPPRVVKTAQPAPPDPRPILPKKEAAVHGANAPSRAAPVASGVSPGMAHGHGPPGVSPLHGKITTPGASVVYVLDRSGSMGRDGKLAHAVAILETSLRQLDAGVRFQIVTYDGRAATLRIGGSGELAGATPDNLRHAGELLDELTGEGSSRHVEGLRAGLALRPDLLILLTDADELSSKDVQEVRRRNTKGTLIHVVLIGASYSEQSTLKDLAGPQRLHVVALPTPAIMP